jgi:sugar/nucleoside kinase (ribokinase family)
MTGLKAMPQIGREHYADAVVVTPGGGALISAAFLRSLGRNVVLAASLGTDPLSCLLEPQLRKSGVGLSLLERFDGGPQLTVALAVGDDRSFITHRAGPAVPDSLAGHLRRGNVRHLHIAELATLLEAQWLIDVARECAITISLDVAWDEAAIRQPGALALARAVDLLFPNAPEAAALTGLPVDPPEPLLRMLATDGPTVVLKQGRQGAIWSDGTWQLASKALAVEAVDATGAGDAFAAGFIDAWIDNASPAMCLARATACGAFAVSHVGGARTVPTRAAILDLEARVAVGPFADAMPARDTTAV